MSMSSPPPTPSALTLLSSAVLPLSIATAAILGVLTRVFLNSLFSSSGANITSRSSILFLDLPSNFLGTFLFAFHKTFVRSVPLHQTFNSAWSTGYAASVTTFASWNFQVTTILVRGQWLESLLVLLLGVSTATTAFILGTDLANLIISLYPLSSSSTSGQPSPTQQPLSCPAASQPDPLTSKQQNKQAVVALPVFLIFLLFLAACILAAIFDRSNSMRRTFWASATLAPPGALLRWRLATLNPRTPRFPLGTFFANMLGVILDSAVGISLLLHRSQLSSDADVFLPALITGLGGSLSTVSTWMSEIFHLSVGRRYLYLLGSVATAQVLGLLVYGSGFWAMR